MNSRKRKEKLGIELNHNGRSFRLVQYLRKVRVHSFTLLPTIFIHTMYFRSLAAALLTVVVAAQAAPAAEEDVPSLRLPPST